MKVKCIGADYGLTLGKVYDVLAQEDDCYDIVNDHNVTCWYLCNRFEIVKEEPVIKLNEPAKEKFKPTHGFLPGMLVVCVDDGLLMANQELTLGKTYVVKPQDEHPAMVKVMNDSDTVVFYQAHRFVLEKDYQPAPKTKTKKAPKPKEEDKTNFHKHHELIIAWAKGAKIQWNNPNNYEWLDTAKPVWDKDTAYRIAEETEVVVKDLTMVLVTNKDNSTHVTQDVGDTNLQLTFTDGVLIDAKVLQ